MDKHFTLAILGGGCAGLSLAMRLAEAGTSAPSTLILEKNANYINDRTWCFWDERNPELKNWVEHAWSNFKIINGTSTFTKSCVDHPYLMLTAKKFFAAAIAKIALNKQITLLNDHETTEVTKLDDQTWRIKTNHGSFTADKVVDTRPHHQVTNDDSLLWQSFIGIDVETAKDMFVEDTFVLMDFDASFTEGLGFVYVLPTNKNKALVEYTVFSKDILQPHQLEVYLKPALTKYFNGTQYKTLRTEYGRLPMGYQKTKISNDPNYVYAGLFAGGARPSSGYAFQRIQRWAKSCASALLSNELLVAPKKDTAILSIMDAIFLNVLKSNPRLSIAIFYTFFSNCNTNTIIRFLSDHANLRDYLSIIIAMPTLIFLKELPSFVFKRIVRRNHDPIS